MTMKNNRAQAAMEFIMTYSWALLILIIIFVMAWQLGLFNFGGDIKPGKMGFWGVTPVDYKLVDTGVFSVSLINEVGADVTIDTIEVRIGSTVLTETPSPTLMIASGTVGQEDITGLGSGKAGDRYDMLMSIDYTDSRTQTTHKSSGRLWGSYEK